MFISCLFSAVSCLFSAVSCLFPAVSCLFSAFLVFSQLFLAFGESMCENPCNLLCFGAIWNSPDYPDYPPDPGNPGKVTFGPAARSLPSPRTVARMTGVKQTPSNDVILYKKQRFLLTFLAVLGTPVHHMGRY